MSLPADVPVLSSQAEALAAAQELAALWSAKAAEIDTERRVPRAELEALARSGLLGVTVPREFGGAGLGAETLVEVFMILSAADISLGQVPQNHFDFVDTLLVAEPETRRFFYGEVLRGARFGNALAEPGRPSRRDIATTIAPDGEGWRIRGAKFFSTGALTAHWVPVHAKHADGRILTAYVDRNSPGLEVRADWDAFGQRGTFSGTTILDGVWVPSAHVVDRARGPTATLVAQFAGNQLIHAAIETGGAAGALEAATRLLAEAGSPHEADLARLGEFGVQVCAARTLARRAARRVDAVLDARAPTVADACAAFVATDEAKSLAYELGPALANEIPHLRTSGANAQRRGLDRLWRNTRVHSLHDPVRWRQFYVGDFHLNANLPPDVRAMVERGQAAA